MRKLLLACAAGFSAALALPARAAPQSAPIKIGASLSVTGVASFLGDRKEHSDSLPGR